MHKFVIPDVAALKEITGRKSCMRNFGRSEVTSRPMSPVERVERLATENAVVVFSCNSCCMSYVVKRLLCNLGVNPMVIELDQESGGTEMEEALMKMVGERLAIPAVFVGGKLVGGVDRLLAAHISGNLIPQLKDAGALWL